MKYIANVITSSRILFAVLIVLCEPFSVFFWMCYFCGGFTDLIDGTIARRLGQVSSRGAMLDSIADLAFGASILYIVIHNIKFPPWIWICVILIGLIRLIGYGIGFCKYHTFAPLHTYMNKITGAFIFAFPLLYSMVGLHIAGILIAFLGFASALEELGITIRSRTLHRDCKGLFI